MVLLPGLNGTEGLFKPLIDNTPEDINVVAIPYPTHEKYSYPELADVVKAKLQELETPFILIGESFSGPIALMQCKHQLQGLVGIVLVATFVTAPNIGLGRFLPWHFGFKLATPLYAIRQSISTGVTRQFIQSISTELQKVAPSVLAHRIQSIFNVNVIQELKDCPVPIVYFRGTKDIVVPSRNLKLILKYKPDVQVAQFDTQHFLLQSKPQQAWQEILSFIQTINANGE